MSCWFAVNKTSINTAAYGEPFIKCHGLHFLTVGIDPDALQVA